MASVVVSLAGTPTTLDFRDPTVGDLLALGSWRRTTTSVDAARRITTTRATIDTAVFTTAVARLAGVTEETLADLALDDVGTLAAALDTLLGSDRKRVLEVADELVFGLEWDPLTVEKFTIEQLAHWYSRALDYMKRRKR